MRKLLELLALAAASVTVVSTAHAQCAIDSATVKRVQAALNFVATNGNNGGFFSPNRMWSAVVDRNGVLCSVIRNDPDAWPGSRAIAIAKASTANDFSNDKLALSTANLYGLTVPGGSLFGLNNSNPFNPLYLPLNPPVPGQDPVGKTPGGIITFGGGLALYQGGQVIGGLGVSGDTSCADHVIAWRMRKLAGLNGTPSDDNIQYGTYPALINTTMQPHCTDHDIVPK
jgi:uncharacterized protein GlcG (DUF336 family)